MRINRYFFLTIILLLLLPFLLGCTVIGYGAGGMVDNVKADEEQIQDFSKLRTGDRVKLIFKDDRVVLGKVVEVGKGDGIKVAYFTAERRFEEWLPDLFQKGQVKRIIRISPGNTFKTIGFGFGLVADIVLLGFYIATHAVLFNGPIDL